MTTSTAISAYRLRILANNGAHTICYAPAANASRLATTVYDIGAVSLDIRVYVSNTLPVLPFRAAGRPEITYALERLIDLAAAFPDLELDAVGALLLAEIDASAEVHPGGGLVPLSAERWLEKWKLFRERYPEFSGH